MSTTSTRGGARAGAGRPPGAKNRGTAADPAPASEAPAPSSSTTGRPTNEAKMARVLASQYRAAGKALKHSAPLFAEALASEADECAAAVAAWAESSPRLKKMIEKSVSSIALVNVIAVHVDLAGVLMLELKMRRAGVDTSQFDYAGAKAMFAMMRQTADDGEQPAPPAAPTATFVAG